MDRLTQLRGQAGGSRDTTLDTSSAPSEAYLTANESSKYYSLSEEDSLDITPIKDVSLSSAAVADKTIGGTDELISNISPIQKKNDLLGYKIGKQIEAANILSGGVNIFDDNDNSYDGENDLVIDDNSEVEDKSSTALKLNENEGLPKDEMSEATLVDNDAVASKDTEVVLQIDGKNVNAIDIGNGLYLYRREGEEELAAVQIIDDDQQQPSFKFLKVRENAEGNLEVYEEIEVIREVPAKEGKSVDKSLTPVPKKELNKVDNDQTGNKEAESKTQPNEENTPIEPTKEINIEPNKNILPETKTEQYVNGEIIKLNEPRKSPVIHSTPNKEGIPLTKTMVDQQLHPNRHSDNVKTIEVHTDAKHKLPDLPRCNKNIFNENKIANDTPQQDDADEKSLISTEEKCEKDDEKHVLDIKINDEKVLEEAVLGSVVEKNQESKQDIITDNVVDKVVTKEDTSEQNENKKKIEEKTVDLQRTPLEKIEDDSKTIKIDTDKISSTCIEKVNDESIILPKAKEVKKLNQEKDIECEKVELAKVEESDIKKMQKPLESVCEPMIVEEKDLQSKDTSTSSLEMSMFVGAAKDEEDKSLQTTEDKQSTTALEEKNKDISSMEEVIVKHTEGNSTTIKDIPPTSLEENNSSIKNVIQEKIQVLPSDQNVIKPIMVEKIETKELQLKLDESIPNTCLLEKVDISKIEVKDTKQKDHLQSSNIVNKEKTDAVTSALISKKEEPSQLNNKIDVNESKKKIDNNVLKNDNAQSVVQNTSVTPTTASGSVLTKESTVNSLSSAKHPEMLLQSKPSTNIMPSETKSHIPQKQLLPNRNIKTDTNIKQASTSNLPESSMKLKESFPLEKTHRNIPNISILNQKNISKIYSTNFQKQIDNKSDVKKDVINVQTTADSKQTNNNHAPVPFGKWTEANRQAFVNKIKEPKIHTNTFNTNQIKQPNDLNRRDILKKFDSQRQSNNAVAAKLSKEREESRISKLNVKSETKTFINKPVPQVPGTQGGKLIIKPEEPISKMKPIINKKPLPKVESTSKPSILKDLPNTVFSSSTVTKEEPTQRKEINNQHLIDITIEDMIHKALAPTTKSTQEALKPQIKNEKLVAMEKTMNELHGKPFVERAPHELPQIKTYGKADNSKTALKVDKIPNLLPYTNKNQPLTTKDDIVEIDSEEEVIEHEPITGDIGLPKNTTTAPITTSQAQSSVAVTKSNVDSKKGSIITENEFDKFARRNSITYENRLTVNFDDNQPRNVIQTIVEKEANVKKVSRNEMLLAEAKVKSSHKHYLLPHKPSSTIQIHSKLVPVSEEALNKNYPSKLQVAYQSALTAKQQKEPAITIIEDKPVKVLFMEYNSEYQLSKSNVQGSQLSPAKKPIPIPEPEIVNDSVDSDILEAIGDSKSQDDSKTKIKHQRKQVLTPVETPELELIEPTDLKLAEEVSPKKKRKPEDVGKSDKNSKNLLPKKTYLLGRSAITEEKPSGSQDVTTSLAKETPEQNNIILAHKDTASAIDNLVKAAEFVETQSGILNTTNDSAESSTSQATPVKRGRGRPRKYPLPEGSQDKGNLPASPQKRPRLIDAKKPKETVDSDDDSSSDDEMIMENWTMGKINENIVCPICNKLFRSENVVFKHVKHCTGPSPNRSDSDKRSTRRSRQSGESERSRESKSDDDDDDYTEKRQSRKRSPKKRKSKLSSVSSGHKDEVIVIEDSPVVENPKPNAPRRPGRPRIYPKNASLQCEICGKTFRQVSYLAHHKLQHKKVDSKKKAEKETPKDDNVFNCEVCEKKFRKLHHLVQHRNSIHNPNPKPSRKSSSEQSDTKALRDQDTSKAGDDQSAAFRCEPCDKSFRKLHHLVEHRETHDGINRQKLQPAQVSNVIEKPAASKDPPQCDICKKTFRKLHHLIEHKEQHVETSSEKSDDKSIKSSLSTKDIIHECSLCYMVFPNEHSLTKHTVICQKKKKQSAAKAKHAEEATENVEESDNSSKADDNKQIPEPELKEKPVKDTEELAQKVDKVEKSVSNIPIAEKLISKITEKRNSKEKNITHSESSKSEPLVVSASIEPKAPVVSHSLPKKRNVETTSADAKKEDATTPAKIKKIEEKSKEKIVVDETPIKKKIVKEKIAPTVTKRRKSSNTPLSAIGTKKTVAQESSDDEEVRYMLNPDFKVENDNIETTFMKIRADKRNSLQVERPNSKDLVKRRTSLQHPPKATRPKPKQVEARVPSTNVAKTPKLQTVPSIDSDDSDVKYSFPEKVAGKTEKPLDSKPKDVTKTPKEKRKTLLEKRKSLSAIAKRKSLGKTINKNLEKVLPTQIKKRSLACEHRCDCGELFSSAALLARHTSLAHTPPRVRRRRDPPPDTPRRAGPTPNAKPTEDARKSSLKSDAANPPKTARKSQIEKETKTPKRKLKSDPADSVKRARTETRRNVAHRGVPVPDKLKKLLQKTRK